MKNSILISFCLFIIPVLLNAQTINDIKIVRSKTDDSYPTDCKNCGTLVFITNIPNLEFTSDMGNITGGVEQSIIETSSGLKRSYSIITKALPIQYIRVKGQTIADYDLPIYNLEPNTCQYFEINYINKIKIDKINVENIVRIARSDCDECGKLVFTTSISNLKFISQVGNIIDVVQDVEKYIDGNKYVYTVIIKTEPTQTVTITGPNIANYDLKIDSLKPTTFQDFRINYETPPIAPDISEEVSSFKLNSIPDSANLTLTIGEKSIFNGFTPHTFYDLKPDKYNISLSKNGFYPVNTTIIIDANKQLEKDIQLSPIVKPEISEPVFPKIKKYRRNQTLWLTGAGITAAAGGYFKYTADQKYKDYQKSNNSDEADNLKKKVQLYDKLTIGSFSLAGICTVGFTISTVKKGKAKGKTKDGNVYIEMNGQGARLTYNF